MSREEIEKLSPHMGLPKDEKLIDEKVILVISKSTKKFELQLNTG